ncbi:cell death-inducing p53-target protein 1 homolog [Ptychodera flava]|uniref:cell death-inducing p53-target protein 1 homolog n=1 Tax=Ptychodera flava TaxID=63121 RepID=UPI00396A1BB1
MDDKPPPYPGDVPQGGYQQPPPTAYNPVQQPPYNPAQQPPPQPGPYYTYSQQPATQPHVHQPYPQAATHHSQTVVVTAPAATTFVATLGPSPTAATCPNCSRNIVTHVESEPNGMAWLCCFLMFICGFWICCFIPFCMDSFQDVTHRCPNCKYVLGKFTR